jgi:hypothetical protein
LRDLLVLSVALFCAGASAQKPAQKAPNPAAEPFALSKLARAGGRFGMLLRQFKADEPMLPDRHEAGAKPAMAEYQSACDVPAGYWVWQKPYWFVFRDGPDTAPQPHGWSAAAACGAPDTPEPGHHETAWAAREPDALREWLLLEYDAPVKLVSVEVHETDNPGALAAISILQPDGEELELWRAGESKPVAEKARELQLDVPLGFVAERVLLRFHSEQIPGRSAIDAVGLKDDKGTMHWASRAEASSTFAATVEAVRIGALRGVVLRPVAPAIPPRVVPPRPRFVLEGPRLDVEQVVVRRAPAGALVPAAAAVAGEVEKLRAQVAELQAKVKVLEEALAREKAKQEKQGK